MLQYVVFLAGVAVSGNPRKCIPRATDPGALTAANGDLGEDSSLANECFVTKCLQPLSRPRQCSGALEDLWTGGAITSCSLILLKREQEQRGLMLRRGLDE